MARPTNGDRTAAILGAGFSKAISDSMPTLSELNELVLSDLDTSPAEKTQIKKSLKRFGDNLEQWMSFLSADQPWLGVEDNLANRSLFERVRNSLDRCIRVAEDHALREPIPDWLTRLVLDLVRHQNAGTDF